LLQEQVFRLGYIDMFDRLCVYLTATEAYRESTMVKVAIEDAIAEHFCNDKLTPILENYQDEKARILTSK